MCASPNMLPPPTAPPPALQPLLKAFLRHLFETFSQEHTPPYLEITSQITNTHIEDR